MANSPFFWKLIHRSYVASPVGNEEVYQEKLKRTQDRLKPDWEMLEIGCGSGNTALAHAPFVSHVTACDFCGPMMDHGRDRVANEGVKNVTFQEASLDALGTDKTYDAVLMLSVIHLIADWKAAVRKAALLTRAGGIFVSSTVVADALSPKMRFIGKVVNALPVLPDVISINREELVNEIKSVGLEIEEDWMADGADSVFIIARKPTHT